MTNASVTETVQSLNGVWQLAMDPDNTGRQDHWFDRKPDTDIRETTVPGALQQAFPRQHGVAWYWLTFVPDSTPAANQRALFQFDAVEYLADVWLNGQHIGMHEGGETPFTLDGTGALVAGENLLAVRVLNPTNTPIDGIVLGQTPHRNKMMDDNFNPGNGLNYGGVVEQVHVRIVPALRVAGIVTRPDRNSGQIEVLVTLQNDTPGAAQVRVHVTGGPAQNGDILATTSFVADVPVGETVHNATLHIPHHHEWSLEDPYLYRVVVTVETTGRGSNNHVPRAGRTLWVPRLPDSQWLRAPERQAAVDPFDPYRQSLPHRLLWASRS